MATKSRKKPSEERDAAEAPVVRRKVPAKAAAPPKSRRRPGAKTAAKKTARKGAARKTAAPRGRGASPADDNGGAGTALVIVESPAKAKTIGKYLGRGYRVKATVGHILDLPKKKLGIDVDGGFEPQYEAIPGKEKTIADLQSAARESSEIFIATDPDREGEAIAAHVAGQLGRRGGAPIRRVLFHEITKDAVQSAIARAGHIDERKVEAQQARRVLDRLVGYKASPLLWKTVKKGLSAGRVQTVALRLIVERERDIRAFKPVEYWTIEAQLEKAGQKFTAKLHHVDGRKPEIGTEKQAKALVDEATRVARATLAEGIRPPAAGTRPRAEGRGAGAAIGAFPVTEVKRRERRKNPSAPFTTSTLQQEGAKKLSFGSKRTMRIAQGLYEGIDLGPTEGAVGLITYMRTDSTRVAESAAQSARDYLRTLFGQDFLAASPQLYGDGKGKNTQDAHESIRPTDPSRRPEHVRKYLTEDQFKLYQLVWQRFMASQMAPAVFDTTTVDYQLGRTLFRSTGSVIKFQGFLALYREAHEEGEHRTLEDEQALPAIEQGERIPVREIVPSQHFTEPPPRFSEASLVKELERLGIGRPSTYASIISVLADRHYVNLEQRRFFPTELGETVEKVMVKQFPDIFDVGFTSEMEQELDRVEEGELGWAKAVKNFYGPFARTLDKVDIDGLLAAAHDLSGLETERCPTCGGKLQARSGFFGPYVACENNPKSCKFTRKLGTHNKPAIPTDYKCQECGEMMVIRTGRSGQFLGCSKFPKCRGTRSLPTGVKCPKDGGDIAERRSKKRGKPFYGCENYPACDFVVWDKPVPETCPECGYVGAEAKSNKTRGSYRKCLKCQNEWDVEKVEEAVAV